MFNKGPSCLKDQKSIESVADWHLGVAVML